MLYEKIAVDVQPGGAGQRLLSGTLGRINPLSWMNLLLTRHALESSAKDESAPKHKLLAKAMERGTDKHQLDDVAVGLEGGDLVDDLIWKKNHGGEHLPWYSRIGGRTWHNKHTTPIMKALGTLGYLPTTAATSLMRSSHYNPVTNKAVIYGDEPAVTSHELGHAIDYNDPTIKSQDSGSFTNRLSRDAYSMLYGIPPAFLWHEAQANLKSQQAINKGMKAGPDKDELNARRWEVLPAGYGSYLGSALAPATGGMSPLAGMLSGKLLGLGVGDKLRQGAKAVHNKKDKEEKKAGAVFGYLMGKLAAIGAAEAPNALAGDYSAQNRLLSEETSTMPYSPRRLGSLNPTRMNVRPIDPKMFSQGSNNMNMRPVDPKMPSPGNNNNMNMRPVDPKMPSQGSNNMNMRPRQ